MKRFVSYLYSIYNNQKIHNAGFARMELRTGRNRVDIHLKENGYAGKTGTVYLFIRKQKNIQGISIGNITFRGNQADFRFEQAEENIGQTPWQITQMHGILIIVDDRPAFLSQWDEQPVDTANFKIWSADKRREEDTNDSTKENILENTKEMTGLVPENQNTEKTVQNSTQASGGHSDGKVLDLNNKARPIETAPSQLKNEDASMEKSQQNDERKMAEQDPMENESSPVNKLEDNHALSAVTQPETLSLSQLEGKSKNETIEQTGSIRTAELQPQPVNAWMQTWRNMLRIYPVMNQFADKSNVLCVRIEIKDVRLLPEKYWSMVNNSFLLHGFFNYRYLVFGRIDQNWFVGIPGIYQNQEHVMASIFGFPDFLPQKEKNEKGEQPGYWYRILDIQM